MCKNIWVIYLDALKVNTCFKFVFFSSLQENFGLRHKLLGMGKGDKPAENQENKSPRKNKRPISLQRSQSFQSGKSNTAPQSYRNEQGTMDAVSMDNLAQSDGPSVRTNSFRLATRLSPIKMEMPDTSLQLSPDRSEDVVANRILTVQKNVDNIPESVRKTIDSVKSPKHRDLTQSPNGQDSLDGSYLEDQRLQRKGRYSSMPVLNTTPPSSPKIQRLHSDRTGESPVMNQKLPLHYTKRIDIKPYFHYSKERLSETLAQNGAKSGNLLSKDEKHVNAFHDAFTNFKKPQENGLDNSLGSKPLTLTQPKPFTSSLRNSAQLLSSHARLNRWGPEKFTKGSMSDLSHLKEDPWIRNKQRSYTESRVTLENHKSPILDRKIENPVNKNISRQSLDVQTQKGRNRTQSVDGTKSEEYTENFDWVVYANRNSIPLSAISIEDVNRKFKYCTPPRGSMEPPPCDKSIRNHSGDNSRYSNSSLLSSNLGDNNTGDSSVSLSANTTSSETCSSPEVLKEFVFDEPFSTEKVFLRDRAHVSRSFSTPVSESHLKNKRHLQEDRPASADILGDVSHIEESEKLVAEMEHYMKKSTSSSGSLSSSNNRFPTTIPNFECHLEQPDKNRHSCISTGSGSSYESTADLSSDHHEGLVVSLKSKITNIKSKIKGKKGQGQTTYSQGSDISPSSPKIPEDERPQRLSQFSFRSKPGMAKSPERDLPTILRDSEPGSQAIGSRMANADLDDYATFSLPRTHETSNSTKKGLQVSKSVSNSSKPVVSEKKGPNYGAYSSSNLIGEKPAQTYNFQAHSETRLCPPSHKTVLGTQSDSALSIQSVDIDSSTPDDSPRTDTNPANVQEDESKLENFYERRFSAVFNSDEAFRDSAVYCDDIDTPAPHPPLTSSVSEPLSPKLNIRSYVQKFEQKSIPKVSQTVKVKHKEPGAVIKQRIQSLAASSEYKSKSSGPSQTTSTTASRCSSRASSEEKTLSRFMLKEFLDEKFPISSSKRETEDDSVFRSHVNSYGKLKPAMSMGRLDSLKSDVNNLVIMKGWVKELIDKFQQGKSK